MNKITIKGKAIRTNNASGEDIIGLWNEIFPLQLTGDIYAVYYHYASNHVSDFDFLIGTTDATLPTSITLYEGNYLTIPVRDNKIENIGETWLSIWSDSQLEAKRAYQTDYEKYSSDGSITIHLSIK
jgi:predicted transcriptional regulator YdeE